MAHGKQGTGDASVAAAVTGNTAAALDLYARLCRADGNLFFSPFSVCAALAMTYAGARGETALQIARALHFRLEHEIMHPAFAALRTSLEGAADAAEGIQLRIANALWPDAGYPFLKAYLDLAEKYYRSAVFPIDYGQPAAAAAKINAWAAEATAHKIVDLVNPSDLDRETALVIANAIYFRGNWSRRFDATLTRTEPFWIKPAEQVPAPMMTQTADLGYAETETAQVVELPYEKNRLGMLLVLPRTASDLREVEQNLTPATLQGWIEGLWERDVKVALPRFEMSCQFALDEALGTLGMRDAFTARANFAGMDGRESGLRISNVLHKAHLDVNEVGTEAAAATAVMMGRGMAAGPLSVRFDRPFLLIIRDRLTGSLAFLGRVVNPLRTRE